MTAALLSFLAVVSATAHIWSLRNDNRIAHYVSKPLTTVLLAILAAVVVPGISQEYRMWIVIGLLFSAAGDVFLMLPRDRFVQGLGAFLLAHVAYLVAFSGRLEELPVPALLALLPYTIASLFLLTLLWKSLGELRLPVIFYTAVIGTMAAAALAVASLYGGRSAWFAASGAALFVVSDAALAMDRFVGNLPHGRQIVMITYYASQWLIAMSVMAA